MKVGLFIPCYIDQLYSKVAIATLELLEKLGLEIHFPINKTADIEQSMVIDAHDARSLTIFIIAEPA